MSGSMKFLIASVILMVGVFGYFVLRDDGLFSTHKRSSVALAPATARSTATPAEPKSAEPMALDPAVKAAYDACVSDLFPTRSDAQERATACSQALQSRQLKPDEIALARLTRGIARTAMGDKALAGEDYIEAVQRYDELIDPRNPNSLELYRRAVTLDANGQTDKALQEYADAIKADPRTSLAFLSRGILLAVRKRAYNRAIEDFNKVLAIDPNNVEALISRGDAFAQLGDNGRAMADLDRAVELAPNQPLVLLTRGQVESRRNDLTGAIRDYEAALKIDPRNADALVNLAAIYSLQGKTEDAIRDLDQAIAIEPRNPLAYYNRGYAHFALRHYDKAIADYSRAIELEPKFGVAYNNRGLSRAAAGIDLQQALTDTNEALKLLPLNLDVRDTKGFIYLKLGEPAKALKEYDSALDLDPNRALALYGRGLAKVKMGDVAAGQADEKAALSLDPETAAQFTVYGLN